MYNHNCYHFLFKFVNNKELFVDAAAAAQYYALLPYLMLNFIHF